MRRLSRRQPFTTTWRDPGKEARNMPKHGIMTIVRFVAAILLLTAGPALVVQPTVLASSGQEFPKDPDDPDEGTCSEFTAHACITRHSVNLGYYCSNAGNGDCITCIDAPNSLCTGQGGEEWGYRDAAG
jgi:hypothetical protein